MGFRCDGKERRGKVWSLDVYNEAILCEAVPDDYSGGRQVRVGKALVQLLACC